MGKHSEKKSAARRKRQRLLDALDQAFLFDGDVNVAFVLDDAFYTLKYMQHNDFSIDDITADLLVGVQAARETCDGKMREDLSGGFYDLYQTWSVSVLRRARGDRSEAISKEHLLEVEDVIAAAGRRAEAGWSPHEPGKVSWPERVRRVANKARGFLAAQRMRVQSRKDRVRSRRARAAKDELYRAHLREHLRD